MFERFWVIKIGGGLWLTCGLVGMVARPVIRKATGWEDWETHDTNQRAIDDFIKK